jgi:hypothetical protein
MDAIQKAARALGRKGGRAKSEAKTAASRANGALGGGAGRPPVYSRCIRYGAHRWSKSGKCPCGQDRISAVLTPVTA